MSGFQPPFCGLILPVSPQEIPGRAAGHPLGGRYLCRHNSTSFCLSAKAHYTRKRNRRPAQCCKATSPRRLQPSNVVIHPFSRALQSHRPDPSAPNPPARLPEPAGPPPTTRAGPPADKPAPTPAIQSPVPPFSKAPAPGYIPLSLLPQRHCHQSPPRNATTTPLFPKPKPHRPRLPTPTPPRSPQQRPTAASNTAPAP